MTTGTDVIAWWGAGLSTLLALLKLWELWRDRFRIDVGHNFTSAAEIGNDIHIRNLSGNPIILCYWELFYRSYWWPFVRDSVIESPDSDAHDIKIEAHSSRTLNFSGMHHFDTGWKSMKRRRICIRLHIAGRRPIVKKV